MTTKESLKILTDEDISKLLNVIKRRCPYGLIACSFLNNVINWKKKSPQNYYTVMVPYESDLEDGTFVCLMQFACYDLFVFTLEESCDKLYNSLISTNLIDWKREILYCAICENHVEAIHKAMKVVNVKIQYEIHNQAWVKEKELSIHDNIVCPPEVYIAQLTNEQVTQINNLWPHRFEGSEEFISIMLNMNYGFGVFLKEDNAMVAWIIKNQFGCLGVLQVEDDYVKKGYGSLITRYLSKKMAEDGSDAAGFVIKSNIASKHLFTKLGFHVLYSVRYMYANHMPSHIPSHCLEK